MSLSISVCKYNFTLHLASNDEVIEVCLVAVF